MATNNIVDSLLISSTLEVSDTVTFSGTSDVVISTTGNVGIGTTSPDKKLEIKLSDTSSGTYYAQTIGGSNYLTGYAVGIGFDPEGYGNRNKVGIIVEGTGSGWSTGHMHFVSVSSTGTSTEATISDANMTITSAGNVGIGTTSPAGKLHIQTDASSEFIFTGASTSGYATTFHMDNTGLDIGHNSTGRALNLKTGSLDRLTILGNGNVGIGTTSISNAKLKVAGAGIDIESSTDSLRLRFYEGTTFRSGIQHVLNTGEMISGSAVGDLAIRANSGNMLFATGSSSERMRIDSSGNVGIGTTSPNAKLHVGPSALIGGYTPDRSTLAISDTTNGGQLIIRGQSPRIWLDGTAGGNGEIYLDNTNLTFQSGNPTSLGSSTMYLKSDGNVGIGTTSPSRRLDVDGIQGWQLSNLETAYLNPTATGADFALKDQYNANIIRLDSRPNAVSYFNGGNVGIGTTSPNDLLQIGDTLGANASMSIASGGTSSSTLYFRRSTAYDAYIQVDANEDLIIGYNSANLGDSLKIVSNTTNVATFDSSGNVGIGVVPKTGGSTWQHIQFGGTGNIISRKSDSTVDAMFANNYYINSSNADSHIITGAATRMFLNDGEIRFDTAPSAAADAAATFTNRMFIANDGNVGIGTTSPGAALHVQSSSTKVFLSNTDYNNGTSTGSGTIITTGATSGNTYSMIYGFKSGNTAYADLVVPGGNVGIGTTAPTAKLDVVSNGLISRFKSTNSGTGGFAEVYYENDAGDRLITGSIGSGYTNSAWAGARYMYATAGDLMIKTLGSGTNLRFYTAGSTNERMRIDGSGNVGIGTTAPGQKLSVAGNIALVSNNSFISFNTSASSGDPKIQMGSDGDFSFLNTAGSTSLHIENGGNVGIGTTSPNSKLTISQPTAGDSTILLGRRNGKPSIKSDSTEGGYLILDSTSSAVALNHYSSNNVWLATGGGNVGIGTTSPGVKLDVNGSIRVTSRTTPTSGKGLEMFYYSQSDLFYLEAYDYTNSLYKAIRYAALSHQFLIGNVGIGTTSPGSSLHIEKAGDQASSVKGITLSSGASGTNKYLPSITWSYGANGTPDFAKIESQRSLGTGARILFSTANSSGTMSEAMRINEDGNVGIGTTSPSEKLTVNGNIDFPFSTSGSATIGVQESTTNQFATGAKELIVQGANAFTGANPSQAQAGGNVYIKGGYAIANTGIGVYAGNVSIEGGEVLGAGTSGAGKIFLKTAGQDRVVVDNAGNVGIGTTSPGAKLAVEVAGTADVIKFTRDAGVNGEMTFDFSGANSNFYSNQGGFTFSGSSSSYGVNFTAAGNVGIGTTSPAKKLEVYSLVNTESSIRIRQASYNFWDLKSPASSTGFAISDVGGERLRITSSGNVGIGTTSPSAKLHVDRVSFGEYAKLGSGDHQLTFLSASNYQSIQAVQQGVAYRNLVLNTSGGNVGIGTTSPSEKLEVDGNILASGDITAFSDARLKENVKTLPNALESVKAMRGVTYNKIGEEKQSIGVIAQEVQAVLPQLVSEHKDEMLSVAYGNITAVLIEAVKELTAKVESLEEQLKNR